MIDEEKSLLAMCKFVLWLFTALLITFIGIAGVFADSYDGSNFSAQLYDNLGPTLNAASTNFESSDNSYYGFIGLTANSSGGAWGISSPTPLLANHTYTMSAELYATGCGSVILSTYNRIGVGTSLSNARTSYMNNTYATENYSYAAAYNILQFAFTPTINASHIVFAYSSTSSGSNCTSSLKSIAFQDLGSSGVSETTINNSLNNQTNILNNSITASTNDIIDNADDNRDAIIDNQNQNTQQQIESQKVCEYIDKNNIELDGKRLDNNGNVSNFTSTGITNYIPLNNKSELKVNSTTNDAVGLCFYNTNKDLISCEFENTLTLGQSITIPANTSYMRATIRKATNVPTFELCKNGSQALADDNKEAEKTRKGILAKLGDLFNTLFSNDDADVSGLNNMVGWLPPGPVDSIINLPLSFFNSLTNTLTGTCTPVSLNVPFVNQTLVLPCFDAYMSQYLTGFNTLWTFVGVTLSVFILYYYLLSLYKWVDDTLTFRENNLPGYYGDNWGGGA